MKEVELLIDIATEINKGNDGIDLLERSVYKDYDDNYFGELSIELYGNKVEVESIWTDKDSHINLHLCDKEFEGDILLKSISDNNQLVVLDAMMKHIITSLK